MKKLSFPLIFLISTLAGVGCLVPSSTKKEESSAGHQHLSVRDSEAVNFEDGTVVYKGKKLSLGDSRFMRVRFERYLNTSVDSKALLKYNATMTEMKRRLMANELRSRENFEEALGLLYEAGEHEEDGSACVVIANHVYNTLRVREEFSDSKFAEAELTRRRKYEEGIFARLGRNGKDAPDSTKNYVTATEQAGFRALDVAETQAQIAATRVRQASNAFQAKIQFQDGIVNLLVQRRWEHASIACGFYRQIFKASSQKLETGKYLLSQFHPATETMDTVDSLEAFAHEAILEASMGMVSVEMAYERGELAASLERLQESFFLGEHLLPVISFDVEKKLKIRDIYTRGREAQKSNPPSSSPSVGPSSTPTGPGAATSRS